MDSGKDQAVITGVSGRYPEANNIEEFWDKLIHGQELYTADDRRWPCGTLGLPPYNGKLKQIDKLDAEFFGISPKDANLLDPQLRILHEVVYEAIWDAGVDPNSLRGTRTGFFMGFCYDDTAVALKEEESKPPTFVQLSTARIPYAFDWKGPSVMTDSACASSFSALTQGLLSMKNGECDQFVVAGVAIQLRPQIAFAFYSLSMLSSDGKSKCLDSSADGYCRSEAVVAIFVQREKLSKRIYARVIDCQTNCDGFKPEGITFPRYDAQLALMNRLYENLPIDTDCIEYVEAHVTGTKAGDPVETRALQNALRKNSDKPLLVGCLKSSMGHSEGASALCAISKVIKIFQTGLIPPNINFKEPNPFIEGLIKGVLKPVLEVTPFDFDLIPVNSFGFGGVNVHALLQANQKRCQPEKDLIIKETWPRLIKLSNRTAEGLECMFQFVESNLQTITRDTLALLEDLSQIKPETGLISRGFLIVDQGKVAVKGKKITNHQRQLWLLFSSVFDNYYSLLNDVTKIQFLQHKMAAIETFLLKEFQISLMKMIQNQDAPRKFSESLVCMVAMQISFFDLFTFMQLKPDGIVGHGLGEIAAAYADGCLSQQEALTIAYEIGRCYEQTSDKSSGLIVYVTERSQQVEDLVATDFSHLLVLSQSGKNSITLTGLRSEMEKVLVKLKHNGIDEEKVKTFQVPCFGKLDQEHLNVLKVKIDSVLGSQLRKRSKNSSRILAEAKRFENEESLLLTSNFFIQMLSNTSLTTEHFKHIPQNSLLIEVGLSNGTLELAKSNFTSAMVTCSMLGQYRESASISVLHALANTYLCGHNPTIRKLFPEVTYPVSRETPSLSPLMKWNHENSWFVAKFPNYFTPQYDHNFHIELTGSQWKFIRGHMIDRRILFPATGYLFLAWEGIMFKMNGNSPDRLAVDFFDVKLHRATFMKSNSSHKFTIFLNAKSENFSIVESGTLCCTGRWRIANSALIDYQEFIKSKSREPKSDKVVKLTSKDVYKELRIRGYDYGETFQGVQEALSDGTWAQVKYLNHWMSFADSCLQVAILGKKQRKLYLPTYIEYAHVDMRETESALELCGKETGKAVVEVFFDQEANIGAAPGLILKGLKASGVDRRSNNQQAQLEISKFVPYDEVLSLSEKLSSQLAEYEKVCLKCLDKIKNEQIGLTKEEEDQIERFISVNDEKFAILSVLYETLKVQETQDASKDSDSVEKVSLVEKLKDLVEKNRRKLNKDVIIQAPISAGLEQQLKVIADNVSGKNITIGEINFTYDLMHNVILEYLEFCGVRCTPVIAAPEDNLIFMDLPGRKAVKFSSDPKRMMDLKDSEVFIFRDYQSSLMLRPLESEFDLKESISTCYECLKEGGFMMLCLRTRLSGVETDLMDLLEVKKPAFETHNQINEIIKSCKFTIISEKMIQPEGWSFILLRKLVDQKSEKPNIAIIEVTGEEFGWVEELKTQLEQKSTNVWLVGEGPTNGIVGLTTCVRKEPKGTAVRCFYCPTGLTRVNGQVCIPEDVLTKDLTFNIVQDQVLGTISSTSIDDIDEPIIKAKHFYANVKTKGDLSSFKWYQAGHDVWGPESLEKSLRTPFQVVKIYYSALNFKDVMVASGRIPMDAYPECYCADCPIGMEWVGVTSSGKRIMGLGEGRGIASSILADERFCFDIPNNISMKEAATIPVAYLTAYYGLLIRGNLLNYETVLIHAGSGAVGQAAISICLARNCQVFTTVGTQEKRDFLKKRFPQLDDHHIANSRDMTFEEQILKVTNGRGVDLVLNSLSEDKLKASMRCLADSGRFIEIGKYDIIQNNKMEASSLDQNRTFHAVCLAHLQVERAMGNSRAKEEWARMSQLLINGVTNGEVQPLSATVFERDEVEKAFRYMAAGKHIGKVLIKLRDEEETVESIHPCIAQTFFRPDKSYIITGGLGGLGLELAEWMLNRGAANLILTSRSGIKQPYQQWSIQRLQEASMFKSKIIISNEDCLTQESAEALINQANNLAPVGGIFILAMVLKDALLENQTPETFEEVVGPKTRATLLLDKITRTRCKDLDHFVCFSSVAAGKGNAGQSNYGFANSSLERICEKRRSEGYPGVAIQWGALGDVGFVAEIMGGNDINIAGTVPQRLPSIFETMDKFLQSSHVVVSSIVLADAQRSAAMGKESLLATICHVLGVKDASKLDPNSTLGDLGMDSLMVVEIKQGLEREYDLTLSTQEIRSLKIKEIPKIEERRKKDSRNTGNMSPNEAAIAGNIDFDPLNVPSEIFVPLNTGNGSRVLLFPPIEGTFKSLSPLFRHITRPITGVNWNLVLDDYESIQKLGEFYVEKLRESYPEESQFDLVGYSFGGLIALEVAMQLQDKFGQQAAHKLVLMDSSPDLFRSRATQLLVNKEVINEDEAHIEVLVGVASCFMPISELDRLKENLASVKIKEQRYQVLVDLINRQTDYVCDTKKVASAAERYFRKMKLAFFYETSRKYNGEITLIRCSEPSKGDVEEFSIADYNLSKYTSSKVQVHKVAGNHTSFIKENPEQVGSYLDTSLTYLQFA